MHLSRVFAAARWSGPGARALAILVMLGLGPASAEELNQARNSLARGETQAALQALQQGLLKRPDDAQLLFLRGVVLMDLARHEEALAVFEQLHQRYPELPEPLNNIALLQARAGQLESARQSLLEALRANPQHRAARTNLGQVYLMLAAQAWTAVAAMPAPEAAVLRRLEAVRALLALPSP